MHGHVRSKELPIYGAKGISLREGFLGMYGKHILNTWGRIENTVNPGDTQVIFIQFTYRYILLLRLPPRNGRVDANANTALENIGASLLKTCTGGIWRAKVEHKICSECGVLGSVSEST